jgi:site-specific recombinase XerD
MNRDKDRYVFMNNDRTTHRKYTKEGIGNAFDRSGLNNPQIVREKGSKATAHTLRHTFALKLAQKGMSLYEIGMLLGHTSSSPRKTSQTRIAISYWISRFCLKMRCILSGGMATYFEQVDMIAVH